MQDFMILVKIDEKGNLQGNMEEIRSLAQAYDKGCRTEVCYQAKIIEMIWSDGYEQGTNDMTDHHKQIALTLMVTQGNA